VCLLAASTEKDTNALNAFSQEHHIKIEMALLKLFVTASSRRDRKAQIVSADII
jgi:hypothetical protein